MFKVFIGCLLAHILYDLLIKFYNFLILNKKINNVSKKVFSNDFWGDDFNAK